MPQNLHSDKENIAIFAATVRTYGVRQWILCPGSRNAPIVEELCTWQEEDDAVWLCSCTDERSAGFKAIGVWEATKEPVGVCVTSGTALLNLLPAAAEAHYRHIPLLVVSADRPARWINQYDGQTVVQTHALRPYATCFTLDEVAPNLGAAWDAMERLFGLRKGPVHLNLPLSEPLFTRTRAILPCVKKNLLHTEEAFDLHELQEALKQCERPLFLCGQNEDEDVAKCLQEIERRGWGYALTDLCLRAPFGRRMAALEQNEEARKALQKGGLLAPDLIVHMGGNFIGKHVKQLLRTLEVPVIRIGLDDYYIDTFGSCQTFVHTSAACALRQILTLTNISAKAAAQEAIQFLQQAAALLYNKVCLEPQRTLRGFLHALEHTGRLKGFTLHVANSSMLRAVASALRTEAYELHCNRGTNGIEGSLSAAVGYSLRKPTQKSLMLIGDLSFFYDCNALFAPHLPSCLRILLWNDNGGGIFQHVEGMPQNAASTPFVAARHPHSAQGICESFGVDYCSIVPTSAEISEALAWLCADDVPRPRLLEVRSGL